MFPIWGKRRLERLKRQNLSFIRGFGCIMYLTIKVVKERVWTSLFVRSELKIRLLLTVGVVSVKSSWIFVPAAQFGTSCWHSNVSKSRAQVSIDRPLRPHNIDNLWGPWFWSRTKSYRKRICAYVSHAQILVTYLMEPQLTESLDEVPREFCLSYPTPLWRDKRRKLRGWHAMWDNYQK